MGVLLVHDNKNHGEVAMAEAIVAGEPTPARYYRHQDKFVEVNAPANALHHDLAEMHKLGYRLATPEEQNAYSASKKKTSRLTERREK